MKLKIELVPSSSFYKNVRSNVSRSEWDIIRRKSYQKANYKCEICGGIGNKHPVECHEIWEYDIKTKIQKLVGFISLCPKCHQVKHIGLSQIRGLYGECLEHLSKVNNISIDKAEKYIDERFEEWQERSNVKWTLDISLLEINK